MRYIAFVSMCICICRYSSIYKRYVHTFSAYTVVCNATNCFICPLYIRNISLWFIYKCHCSFTERGNRLLCICLKFVFENLPMKPMTCCVYVYIFVFFVCFPIRVRPHALRACSMRIYIYTVRSHKNKKKIGYYIIVDDRFLFV